MRQSGGTSDSMHEFEQPSGDSEGQGSLVRGHPWGHRELNTTERLNQQTAAKMTRGWLLRDTRQESAFFLG